MTKNDLILFGMLAAGTMILLPMMAKKAKAAPSSTGGTSGNQYGATEIMRDNGYSYFTDGTVIDPDGRYYYQGTMVYDPRGMYGTQ